MERNPEKAFNLKEIIEGTGYPLPVVMENYGDSPASRFRDTLENLAEEKYVEIRAIKTNFGEQDLYYKAAIKAKIQVSIPASS